MRVQRHQAVAVSGAICEVLLDRPAAMNALSTAMAVRLAQVCAEIAADLQVRAVVLAAAGEHGQLVLSEIPTVEKVQATLFQLVEDEQARLAREERQ